MTDLTPVELIVLVAVSDRARHGYELVRRIAELTDDRMLVHGREDRRAGGHRSALVSDIRTGSGTRQCAGTSVYGDTCRSSAAAGTGRRRGSAR
jgi:hypothetical protein